MEDEPRLAGRGIRQSMSGLHTWSGLLLGWVLYAMFLTGTAAYFKDELSQWMRPELAHQAQVPDQAVVAQRVADEFARTMPGAAQWSLKLSDARNNSVYAFWFTGPRGGGARGFGEGYFDPATGRKVAARDTMGGDFFYRFHFQFHYMPTLWGRWLAGVAAMFMLVAIISGVITHKKIFVDFFAFRCGKGQRSWLDAHNALSVFGLPFHFMITYTGLVTLMALYMPWGERIAIKPPQRAAYNAELSGFAPGGGASGVAAPLASVEAMVRQAQERWGREGVARVNATNPGDAAARVTVTRAEAGRVSMSPQLMEFDGVTGALLNVRESVGAAAEARGVL
ncbi:MAG TPA: PepSY-associated TM helix domain-containing protein, partial [Beijerinckiaceae bacterium]